MSVSILTATSEQQAQAAYQAFLAGIRARTPLIVMSPPGAGKTYMTEGGAYVACREMREKVGIATQTNDQAVELCVRLVDRFPDLHVYFMAGGDYITPPALRHSRIHRVKDIRDISDRAFILVGNSEKWVYSPEDPPKVDLFLVDEAFQMMYSKLQLLVELGRRFVMIGDPGQISPFTEADLRRWRSEPNGPHVPAPIGFLSEHPNTRVLRLPVTRRLLPDTVTFVQGFYPDLPFQALARPQDRALILRAPGVTSIDRALGRIARGESMLMLEMDAQVTGKDDQELAALLAFSIERLFASAPQVREGTQIRDLLPRDVGVVCAHTSQTNAVAGCLRGALTDIMVATANRYQGLERQIVFVHHPLSGRVDLSEFHVEAGRLCVMLSRHRLGCILVGRGGIASVLDQHVPSSERVLGVNQDPEFSGWIANLDLYEQFLQRRRIVPVS